MAVWAYQGMEPSGLARQGRIEAADDIAALLALQRQRLTVYELRPVQARSGWRRMLRSTSSRPLPRRRLIALCRDLGRLLEAGMPLTEALAMIGRRATRRSERRLIESARSAVANGASLSHAMAEAEAAPDGFVLGQLRAGEASGDLAGALQRSADSLDRADRTAKRLQAALLYPCVLLAVTLVAILGILTFVVPQMAPLFAGERAPASAELLLALSAILRSAWPLLAVGLPLSAALGLLISRRPNVRARLDRALLRLPLLGALARANETALVARVLADLLESGQPLPEAMVAAQDAVRNRAFEEALGHVATTLREGEALSSGLAREPVFAPLLVEMAAIGERTGRLAEQLRSLARLLDDELETATDRIIALLPPVLTVLLGGIIGGVVMTITSAILSVNDVAI